MDYCKWEKDERNAYLSNLVKDAKKRFNTKDQAKRFVEEINKVANG